MEMNNNLKIKTKTKFNNTDLEFKMQFRKRLWIATIITLGLLDLILHHWLEVF